MVFFILLSVRRFMGRNGSHVNENDLKAILKRLDVNKDGRVSYSEFRLLFDQPNNNEISGVRVDSPIRNRSPLRTRSPLRNQSPNNDLINIGI